MSSDLHGAQVVRLDLPPAARFVSSARLVAASIAADAGFDVDDLDDLRLGVNELVSALVESSIDSARIALEFVADDHTIVVTGRLDGGGGGSVVTDDLTTRILDAVADQYEIGASSFTLRKASSRRGPA